MIRILTLLNDISSTSIPFELSLRLEKLPDLSVTVAIFYSKNKNIDTGESSIETVSLAGEHRFDSHAWKLFHREIQQDKYDVVHTHHNFSGSVARLLARIESVPIVDTEHRAHDSFSPIQNLVNAPTLPLADRIVANSQATLDSLRWYEQLLTSDEQLSVIHNGIDISRIDAALENVDRESERPRVISVGRMVPVKNQVTLVESFADVAEEVPQAELVLVGSGPTRSKLESIATKLGIGDSVTFTGRVSRDRVYELLATSDVFALPSLSEGFCVAAVEAMAAGLPVVVSDIDVFREVIGEVGCYANPESSAEIADELISLLTDERIRSRTAEACRTEAREQYSLERTVEEYYNLYKQLAGTEDDD